MSTISKNIKSLRKKYSLTQDQLGQIAGVSDKAVSTWENGVAEPRMGAVRKMADYFNISISDILDTPVAVGSNEIDPKSLLLIRSIQGNTDLRKAVLLLERRPELIASLLRLDALTDDEFDLINNTMDRFKGSRRRK